MHKFTSIGMGKLLATVEVETREMIGLFSTIASASRISEGVGVSALLYYYRLLSKGQADLVVTDGVGITY